MVRKFLYFVAILIAIVIAAAFLIRIFADELTQMAFVPTGEFQEQRAFATNIYENPQMWYAHPSLPGKNPAQWLPAGAEPDQMPGSAAIFFVHPTSFISRAAWNAPLDDKATNDRTRIFLRGLASPFASAGKIWAPKYRQATIGAFITDRVEGKQALDAAYQDILLAFDEFLAQQQADRPIILVGHSQGARHLAQLMQDRIAGNPVAKRIVAAYIIGWPVSVETDLPQMGLPACRSHDQTGCIISWQSFAEPAEYDNILKLYAASTGFNEELRGESPILCTNPLTGGVEEDAPAEANLGTLKPDNGLETGELVPAAVPARCDDHGFLLIGDPPDLGNFVLPGNNYHVYDIPLFWANIRADALWRLRKYLTQ